MCEVHETPVRATGNCSRPCYRATRTHGPYTATQASTTSETLASASIAQAAAKAPCVRYTNLVPGGVVGVADGPHVGPDTGGGWSTEECTFVCSHSGADCTFAIYTKDPANGNSAGHCSLWGKGHHVSSLVARAGATTSVCGVDLPAVPSASLVTNTPATEQPTTTAHEPAGYDDPVQGAKGVQKSGTG